MKVNCGTDIIEISRIKKSIEKMGDKFLKKVFTENEIKYCESKRNQKYQHYSARFAAKEAVFKAISKKLYNKYAISWQNIEIQNDNQGRPKVNILGMNLEKIENIDISLSHCKEYAIANVVVISK